MSSLIAGHDLLLQQIHLSICLLRLFAERPGNLEELVSDHNGSLLEKDASNDVHSEESYPEDDFDEAEITSSEGLKDRGHSTLLNKVLDRLAETLARYKTDRTTHRGLILDSKHVSSTLMIVDEDHNKVKILCAKNEGLDQQNSTSDTDFLASWKTCMERISREGFASEDNRSYMFDLILEYQSHRITYYLDKLRIALAPEATTTPRTQEKRPEVPLTEEWLQKLSTVHTCSWIDDNANEFQFSNVSDGEADEISRAALSAQSLENIDEEVDTILKLADQICSLGEDEGGSLRREILNELLPSLYSVWRSPRHQASIKGRLHARFKSVSNAGKRKNDVITALKFLCRVYYSVDVFLQAAQSMPIFTSVECIPVPLQTRILSKTLSSTVRAQPSPLEVAGSLGLYVRGARWLNHLESKASKECFRELQGEKRHVHAEIQLLSYQMRYFKTEYQKGRVHPYIGCSKLCCLLCWLLLRVHGGYHVRGTHETIMHRWEMPSNFLSDAHSSEHQPILRDFLCLTKMILQHLLDQSFPLKHPRLLAQSSAALSTIETVLEREKARMEKSQLNMRQLMMMPIIGQDGLLITDLHEKPGFVSVIGGSLTKPKEMSCEDAEVFRENHIRLKFGLEKSDEMPPKQGKFAKRCRRCYRASSLRCSLCRSSYCSKACQKKHWSQHVFVCRVAKRPNGVDYLRLFLNRWSHATGDELKQAQILSELYSDDDLCKTFGFNDCAERHDVDKLLCFYTHMISTLGTKCLQVGLDRGNLGDYMGVVAEIIQHEGKANYSDCLCFPWFLHRQSFLDCVIPNWEGDFVYQAGAFRRLEHALCTEEWDDAVQPLSSSEREVLRLYSILFRDFNNIPDSLTSMWLEFGFCYCTTRSQAMELATLYVQLAKSGASLEEIAKAYEVHTLPALMRRKGLQPSIIQVEGISFHRPDLEDLGIYRLIAEVTHALSGHFCDCHLQKKHCHPKFETHLSLESDGDYVFHGTNTWERWQLFNFYRYVFSHRNFNPRKMQEAKRHPDKEKLDQYLDSLVPGFRENIGNRVLGDVMFPKLKAAIRFPNGRPPCWCVMHDTIAPEGLFCFTSTLISQLRSATGEDEASEDKTHAEADTQGR